MLTLRRIPLARTALFLLFGALSWHAAAAPAHAQSDPPSAPNTNPWVSAYYAGWFWDWHPNPTDAVNAVDMTTMTHFIFGRYAPGAGTLGGSAGQLIQGAGTGHAQSSRVPAPATPRSRTHSSPRPTRTASRQSS